jgi:RHS repeat-associated protein
MAMANPFRFSTKYQDDETGLLYFGYRYYDPSTGGWNSRDPIGESGGVAVFAFAANNPVDAVDRNGLDFGTWMGHPVYSFAAPVFEGSHQKRIDFLNCLMRKLFAETASFLRLPKGQNWWGNNMDSASVQRLLESLSGYDWTRGVFQYYLLNYINEADWGVGPDSLNLPFLDPHISKPDLYDNPVNAITTLLHEPMHDFGNQQAYGAAFHSFGLADTLESTVQEMQYLALRTRPKKRCCGDVVNQTRWEEFLCDCNRVVFGKATHEDNLR